MGTSKDMQPSVSNLGILIIHTTLLARCTSVVGSTWHLYVVNKAAGEHLLQHWTL